MKTKTNINLFSSIFCCGVIFSAAAMEEAPIVTQQEHRIIHRQKLYFASNIGCTYEELSGYTYAHFPIQLADGQYTRITFLTSVAENVQRNNEAVNAMLQPESDRTVANLACANIRDDAITNWYVQMFGVSDNDEVNKNAHVSLFRLENGAINIAEKIIHLNNELNEEQKGCFRRAFTTIASNPVGRVLLYRILVEVTRCYETANERIWSDINFNDRECYRFIKIAFNHPLYDVYNDNDSQVFTINMNDFSKSCVVNTYLEYRLDTCSTDVSLFRKLITWYHALQDINTAVELYAQFPSSLNGKNTRNIYERYKITTGDNLAAWWNNNLESIRAILGDDTQKYGMSISENAYLFTQYVEQCRCSYQPKIMRRIHWGSFFDTRIYPDITGVVFAMETAASCVYNITGVNVLQR